MTRLLRPSFVWRSARAMLRREVITGKGPDNRVRKGAPKRMTNAQAEIDELVLARADEIRQERRRDVGSSHKSLICACVLGDEPDIDPSCRFHGRYTTGD